MDSLSTSATASSSNDSCAITWHQWQAAYPTEISTGTSRRLASANASADHGHQCTGLSLCCSRYGEVASPSRFTRPASHGVPRPSEGRDLFVVLAGLAGQDGWRWWLGFCFEAGVGVGPGWRVIRWWFGVAVVDGVGSGFGQVEQAGWGVVFVGAAEPAGPGTWPG